LPCLLRQNKFSVYYGHLAKPNLTLKYSRKMSILVQVVATEKSVFVGLSLGVPYIRRDGGSNHLTVAATNFVWSCGIDTIIIFNEKQEYYSIVMMFDNFGVVTVFGNYEGISLSHISFSIRLSIVGIYRENSILFISNMLK